MINRLCSAIFNILLYILGISICIFFVPKVIVYFFPFVLAYIISLIASPLVNFLSKKINIHRKHSSIIISVFVLAIIFICIYLIISLIVSLSLNFFESLPQIIKSSENDIKAMENRIMLLLEHFPIIHKNEFKEMLSSSFEQFKNIISEFAFPTLEIAKKIATFIPKLLVYSIVTIVATYIFIVENERVSIFFNKITPKFLAKYVSRMKKDFKNILVGYFLVQIKISLAVMVIIAICFFILKIKSAILLAILIGIFDYLPVVGAGTILIPWAIVEFIGSNYFVGVGLIITYLLTQVLKQIFQPKMMGEHMGMPGILTLLSLFIGFKLKGFTGMLIAIPIGMIILRLYEYGIFDSLKYSIKVIVDIGSEFRKKGLK